MIYDGIAAIGRYRGLYKGLDVLIDWLGKNDYKSLPTGRNEILGAKVFANVMDAQTHTYGNGHYEVHRRYLDLQVDVEGTESFYVTPGPMVPLGEFDDGGDFQLLDAAPDNGDEIHGNLAKDHFAVFVPGEPHMPTCVAAMAEPAPVRKICFKILADEFWD